MPSSARAKSRSSASSFSATGFARAARSRRKPITLSVVPAIFVASDSAAAFGKSSSCAASWRSARMRSMRGVLSNLPACGPWSDARVAYAS